VFLHLIDDDVGVPSEQGMRALWNAACVLKRQ
jgi:hypothetical protein